MDAPALLKWASVGVVKGVTAKQSWFVSIIFPGPMSRNTPGVFEEEAHFFAILEVQVKNKPQPLVP